VVSASAEKKAHRTTEQGLVECYIHAGGRIGALVEVTARQTSSPAPPDFKTLAP